MEKKVRWGILGCGGIAEKFAEDLQFTSNSKFTACGSRSIDKANQFSEKYGGEHAFGSYEELAECDDVDIVYVATPHPMHFENSMLCLENGKAVLCEKPFTLNCEQAKEMVGVAREKKIFLMEAMWTRFIPTVVKVRNLLENGAIGEVRNFTADLVKEFEYDTEHRIFNPQLGGGALLDLGVYPISFASMVFKQKPKKIASVVKIGQSGVDYNESLSFLYDSGAVASITAGLEADTGITAFIAGTKGSIRFESMFFRAKKAVVERGGELEEIKIDFPGTGYQFEAEHAAERWLDGKFESDVIGLDESIEIMETMDEIRRDWGLVYPQEK